MTRPYSDCLSSPRSRSATDQMNEERLVSAIAEAPLKLRIGGRVNARFDLHRGESPANGVPTGKHTRQTRSRPAPMTVIAMVDISAIYATTNADEFPAGARPFLSFVEGTWRRIRGSRLGRSDGRESR